MRIESIHIENFKRFTDLHIEGIPTNAKLVVVVGPNGCGKSSLFDAFLDWHHHFAGWGHSGDEPYYRKDAQRSFNWGSNVTINLHDDPTLGPHSLYVRTAYRNEPDFSVGEISSPQEPAALFQGRRLIDLDMTVSDNYRRVIYETTAGVYDEQNDEKKVKVLREELIGQIRESMNSVFEDLILNNIRNPLDAKGNYGSFSLKRVRRNRITTRIYLVEKRQPLTCFLISISNVDFSQRPYIASMRLRRTSIQESRDASCWNWPK